MIKTDLEKYIKKVLDEQQNTIQRLTKRVNVLEPKCQTQAESVTALQDEIKTLEERIEALETGE